MYFPNLFPEAELAKSHSPWIFEERNTVVIFQRDIMVATCAAFGCINSRKNSPALSFHRNPAANAENKLLRSTEMNTKHSSRRSLAKG